MRPIRYRRNFGLTRREDEDFTGEALRPPIPSTLPPVSARPAAARSWSYRDYLPSTRRLKDIPSRMSREVDKKVNASPAASILTAVIMGFLIGKLLTS